MLGNFQIFQKFQKLQIFDPDNIFPFSSFSFFLFVSRNFTNFSENNCFLGFLQVLFSVSQKDASSSFFVRLPTEREEDGAALLLRKFDSRAPQVNLVFMKESSLILYIVYIRLFRITGNFYWLNRRRPTNIFSLNHVYPKFLFEFFDKFSKITTDLPDLPLPQHRINENFWFFFLQKFSKFFAKYITWYDWVTVIISKENWKFIFDKVILNI